jgi:Sec7-like guanine-nucleotide exchange factor
MNEYSPDNVSLFWSTKEDRGYSVCDPITIPELNHIDISKAESVFYSDLGEIVNFQCKLATCEISFSLHKGTKSYDVMMGVAKPKEPCNA